MQQAGEVGQLLRREGLYTSTGDTRLVTPPSAKHSCSDRPMTGHFCFGSKSPRSSSPNVTPAWATEQQRWAPSPGPRGALGFTRLRGLARWFCVAARRVGAYADRARPEPRGAAAGHALRPPGGGRAGPSQPRCSDSGRARRSRDHRNGRGPLVSLPPRRVVLETSAFVRSRRSGEVSGGGLVIVVGRCFRGRCRRSAGRSGIRRGRRRSRGTWRCPKRPLAGRFWSAPRPGASRRVYGEHR